MAKFVRLDPADRASPLVQNAFDPAIVENLIVIGTEDDYILGGRNSGFLGLSGPLSDLVSDLSSHLGAGNGFDYTTEGLEGIFSRFGLLIPYSIPELGVDGVVAPLGDVVDLGPGNDVMWALSGNDIVLGGDGNDVVFGGTGTDLLFGEDGNDVLVGGAGDDYVQGAKGDDILLGGDGDDNIFGGDGADVLYGGPGNDFLSGGGSISEGGVNSFDRAIYRFGEGIDSVASSMDQLDVFYDFDAYDLELELGALGAGTTDVLYFVDKSDGSIVADSAITGQFAPGETIFTEFDIG